MARGQVSKQIIADKILNTFEGAFAYNDGKEIRIPLLEEGELIQVKVTLTAAKENVNPGDDNAVPGGNVLPKEDNNITFNKTITNKEIKQIEATDGEKQNVKDLLAALGL